MFRIVDAKGEIYNVLAVEKENRGTYFLVWKKGKFRWVSADEVRLLDETLWS